MKKRILIIDDNSRKARRLVEEVESLLKNEVSIIVANCISEGVRKTLEGDFEYIFVDMQMPNFMNENIDIQGGWDYLSRIQYKLKRKGNKLPKFIFNSSEPTAINSILHSDREDLIKLDFRYIKAYDFAKDNKIQVLSIYGNRMNEIKEFLDM